MVQINQGLKPCPFCGGEAEHFVGVVSCKSSMCGARLSRDGTVRGAIEGWNRRTPSPRPQDER